MACKTKTEEVSKAWVCVAELPHLCRVQRATRALCRSAGFDESAVYQAVSAVTDLAFGLYSERSRRVDLTLSAVRRKDGLELRAEDSDPAGFVSPVRVSFPFPPARAAQRASL